MTKVMAPAQINMKAGSRAMLVSLDRLLKVSFSVHAQIPIASTPRPSSCWLQIKMGLKDYSKLPKK